MAFAPVVFDLSYWEKLEKPGYRDLLWNVPEQKTGRVNIIGGNSQGFNTVVRVAEYLTREFPVKEVRLLMPEALRGKLPPLPNVDFARATESGGFARSAELKRRMGEGDFEMLIGDLAKNAETEVALGEAVMGVVESGVDGGDGGSGREGDNGGEGRGGKESDSGGDGRGDKNVKPMLVTRDAVDVLAAGAAEGLLKHPKLFIVASMVQLQKLFRAVYYPKMIMLSSPLVPVVETLHKFTLSYGVTILTFHEGKVLVAREGKVVSVPIEATEYSPVGLWSGTLAARVVAMNLFNPSKPLEATVAALGRE